MLMLYIIVLESHSKRLILQIRYRQRLRGKGERGELFFKYILAYPILLYLLSNKLGILLGIFEDIHFFFTLASTF